jgi:hypothetical protein
MVEDEKENGEDSTKVHVTSSPRGTKRRVVELPGLGQGEKKVRKDKYKSEVLPPHGESSQIDEIAELGPENQTDEEFGNEIALRLNEDKADKIVLLVKMLGRNVILEFFAETRRVEQEGGLPIGNGTRRRTAGGVMLHLLRSTDRPEVKENAEVVKFFEDEEERMRKIFEEQRNKKEEAEVARGAGVVWVAGRYEAELKRLLHTGMRGAGVFLPVESRRLVPAPLLWPAR